MTKKCKRTWSYEKFRDACVKRAKRLNVKLNVAGLQKCYDGNLSIPFAVETLTVKTPAKKKAARRNVEAAATPA